MRADRALVVLSLALALAAAVLVTGPLDVGRENFIYVFLPACCALIPLASSRPIACTVAAALMLLFMFLEIQTVGVYYLPAAGAMAAAALIANS